MNGTAAHGAVVLFSAPDLRLSARRLRFRAPALDAAAVSLGILAGTLTRRVVPAMALTAAAFVVTRLGVGLIARPHFLAPLHRVVPVVGGDDPSAHGSYVISSDLYDAAGRHLTHDSLTLCTPGDAACAGKFGSGPLHGAYNVVVYQPDSRFWVFQAVETALSSSRSRRCSWPWPSGAFAGTSASR